MSFDFRNHKTSMGRSHNLEDQKRVLVLSESKGFVNTVQNSVVNMEDVEALVFKDVFSAIRSLIREGADLLLIDKNNAQVYGLKLDVIMEELALTQVPVVCASWSKEHSTLSFNKKCGPKDSNETGWKLILRLEDALPVA